MDTTTDSKFYSFSDEKRYFENILDNEIINIFFHMDYRQDSYEMTIYTFWDMIGIIGGVYEATKVILGIFMNFYSSKLMKIDLINSYKRFSMQENQLEQEDDPENRSSRQNRNKKHIRNKSESSQNHDNLGNYSY